MWLLSFAILAVSFHERPDGHKLLITTDHRRDPDLARTAPLTLADHRPAPTASYPDPTRPTRTQRTLPILTPAISSTRRPSPTPTSSPPTPPPTEPPMQTTTERCLATDAKSPPQPRQLPRPVPYQSSPHPLPRPPSPRPLIHKRPRRIGDDYCRDRRAPARRDITPLQTRRHHAAAGTPRTTPCLTALSRRPLLTLPAAPPRRIVALRAPREPRRTPPQPTATTAHANTARAPRCPPRKHHAGGVKSPKAKSAKKL